MEGFIEWVLPGFKEPVDEDVGYFVVQYDLLDLVNRLVVNDFFELY